MRPALKRFRSRAERKSGQHNINFALEAGYGSPSGFLPQVAKFEAENVPVSPHDIVASGLEPTTSWLRASHHAVNLPADRFTSGCRDLHEQRDQQREKRHRRPRG